MTRGRRARCCRVAAWPRCRARTSPARSPAASRPDRSWRPRTPSWRPSWHRSCRPIGSGSTPIPTSSASSCAARSRTSMALAAGMVDGLGFGDSAKAGIITRGLAEMTRLGVAAGAHPLTFAGLAGVGDLIATCMSPLSRNRRAGELIASGVPWPEAGERITRRRRGRRRPSPVRSSWRRRTASRCRSPSRSARSCSSGARRSPRSPS